ncbi:MAG: hypothetical protein K0B07_03815 [DPANN group archaeon]|nr:hypothetical protein [DPANN group archaeon]
MKFPEFLRNYEAERITEGELILVLCSNYLTVGNLKKIDYATPKNHLKGYNSVFIKNPVNLELRPPAGKFMPSIRFTEDNISEISNRQEWNLYFFAYGHNKISDIFAEQVNQLSKFNNSLKSDATNHFITIIRYIETVDKITDDAILDILNERPELYHK